MHYLILPFPSHEPELHLARLMHDLAYIPYNLLDSLPFYAFERASNGLRRRARARHVGDGRLPRAKQGVPQELLRHERAAELLQRRRAAQEAARRVPRGVEEDERRARRGHSVQTDRTRAGEEEDGVGRQMQKRREARRKEGKVGEQGREKRRGADFGLAFGGRFEDGYGR